MKKLFFILLVLHFCKINAQEKVSIQDADKALTLIFSNPYQAKIELDRLELLSKKQNDSLYSIILNSKGIYYAQLTKMDSALIYFNKSSALSDKTTKRYINTQVNIAIVLKKTGQIDKAIHILKTNLLLANQKKYNATRATIYGELASCYGTKDLYKDALEHILISIEIWENEIPRPAKKIAVEKQKLANLYFKMGNMERALEIYQEILPVFKESNDVYNFNSIQVSIANINLELNAPEKAFKLLQNIIPNLTKLNNKELLLYAYDREAKSLEMIKNYPLAVQKYKAAILYGLKFNQIKTLYTFTQAGNLFLKLKDSIALKEIKVKTETAAFKRILPLASTEDQMHYYKWQEDYANVLNDKINTAKNKQIFDSLAVRLKDKYNVYQVRELQVKSELKSIKKEKEKVVSQLKINKLQVAFLVLVIAILILFGVYYRKKINKKQTIATLKLESLSTQNKNANQLIQKEQYVSNKQKTIISDYEKEIAALALEKVETAKLIKEITAEIAMASSVNNIKSLKKLQTGVTPYWKNALDKFNHINPRFNLYLIEQFPNLTKGERDFSLFVKLGLSNKEIAYLLNISADSVITKKYRLLKKLNLPKDIDFQKWLADIE